MALEELAIEDFPRAVEWQRPPSPDTLAAFHVTVIGAGISGILAALHLRRLGIPYLQVERMSDLGGTWLWNKYPDARVDVNTFLYQYKFEKNYPWTRYFSTREDILDYLNHVVDKYGLRPQMRFDTEIAEANWDEADSKWHLRTWDGSAWTSNVIISAAGLFSTAVQPDLPGIGDFAGPVFHTTTWDPDYDVRGKVIALIGNGSSGTQLAPAVAEKCRKLFAFQRTPNWITPIAHYRDPVPTHLRWMFDNVPYYWNWYCYATYEAATRAQEYHVYDADWIRAGGQIGRANDRVRAALTDFISSRVGGDEQLLAKLVPKFPPFARRMVVDNGWYDTLMRDNVQLVTDPIRAVVEEGIVTTTGDTYKVDLIIAACGYQVSKYFWPTRYTGSHGMTLEEFWKPDGARAYLGMTMPNFPNFFVFYGPNAQPRAGGFHQWAEMWTRYILQLIVAMIERGAKSLTCRQSVFDDYNRLLDERHEGLVVKRGNAGGYGMNEHGRPGVGLPFTNDEYYSMIRRANLDDYVLS